MLRKFSDCDKDTDRATFPGLANDWLLEICSHYCFLCGEELPPPEVGGINGSGVLGHSIGIELKDKNGYIEESEEAICHKCCCANASRE